MGIAAIFFSGAEPFEQIVDISIDRRPMWNMVKTVDAFSEKTFKELMILYMYKALVQGQIIPKILTVAKHFYYFNHIL